VRVDTACQPEFKTIHSFRFRQPVFFGFSANLGAKFAAGPTNNMKVLLAEDDLVTMKMMTGLLENWGYEVVSAKDGARAWEILQRDDAPSLAVVDWQMPGMKGDELCRIARAELPNRPLYILLVTARNTRMEDKVSGLGAGADDYLVKPFEIPEMRARLQVGERVLRLQNELRRRVLELEQMIAQVRQLQGLLPICVHCKKIRDDQNYWHQVENYISDRSAAEFTHSICPSCFETQIKKLEPKC
jgi:DNA-binding response OmpR family regulator